MMEGGMASLLTCCLLLGLVIGIDAGSHGKPTSSRLVEKELDLDVADDRDRLIAGYKKPLNLSGYFKLNRTYDAHMFYFFFEATSKAGKEEPLAVWMTGGPGCSSELAVFYENGPYRINDDLSLRTNKYGWQTSHHMIFVDQPINTGFSYSEDERDRVYDEDTVAADMIDFLSEFREAHPEFFKVPLYVTGESYAGHYVPAVTYAIVKYNKAANEPFNLEGFAIGNGLTDPAIQYGSYADFAFSNGLISKSLQSTINTIYPICRWGIYACNSLQWDFVCSLALVFCQDTVFGPVTAAAGANFNVYDIRKPCIGPLCYDFSLLDKYLALPSTRKELGIADERTWQSCNPDVYSDFLGDIMRSYTDKVSAQLEAGIRVLIYVGTEDFICNVKGNQKWVETLHWTKRSAYQNATEKSWEVDGKIVGSIKSAGPLSFVKVFQSGHMVPMDQPKAALDMITSFTHGADISSGQPISDSTAHRFSVHDASGVRAGHLIVE